jgi:hypothetical protein
MFDEVFTLLEECLAQQELAHNTFNASVFNTILPGGFGDGCP